jgi:hypothetical protein
VRRDFDLFPRSRREPTRFLGNLIVSRASICRPSTKHNGQLETNRVIRGFLNMSTASINAFILLVLLPAWLAVGLMDWHWHRRSRIELNSGPKESALHLALSGVAGFAVLSALLLEIDAAVLIVLIAAFIFHEVVTTLDIKHAFSMRVISPAEQRTHDFMTAIPFAALCLTTMTHTHQAAAILGLERTPGDWELRWKDPALPLSYLLSWVAAAFLLNVLPFAEELFRGLRARGIRDKAP